MNKIIWEIIVDLIILVLTLVVILFVFGIKQRSEGRLAVSWNVFLFGMVIFGIAKTIEILNESEIISTGPLEKTLYVLFVVLLVIGFWNMLKCIREVDGEIEVDGKFKIRKH